MSQSTPVSNTPDSLQTVHMLADVWRYRFIQEQVPVRSFPGYHVSSHILPSHGASQHRTNTSMPSW
jgi:hypothetical protein